MAFDVSKFLALTALIASTGAACSSTDKDKTVPPEGGAPGIDGVSGKAGFAGNPSSGGGAAAGGGGEGGEALVNGGAAVGGAGLGGEGGAGDVVGECLGALAAGGAGGAAAVADPSLEDLCADFFTAKCAASIEDDDPTYKVCEGVKERALPAVAIKVADCLKALNADDACDAAKTAACYTDLIGQGCENPNAATACASIHTNCDAVTVASCEQVANLVSDDMYEGFTGCMDPTDEGWYEPAFTGTCTERLDYCAGVRLLK